MTSVLVWNVQNFGINKYNSPWATRRGANTGGLTLQQASIWRQNVFAQVYNATIPDIIVIVEVSSGDSTPNHLASLTGGLNGCDYLLTFLRTASPHWRLVPPLRIGQGGKAEAVAVFYRGQRTAGGMTTHRYFTGPNVWTGGYAGQSAVPGTAAAAAYPAAAGGNPDLRAMIVPPGTGVRAIPGGALHNGGTNEDRVAARTVFREDNHGAPGNILDFDVFREPYMTTFTETDNAGNVTRNLTLFSVHSPAVTGDQSVFISYLASAFDIVSALGAAETRIVAGDFNLNLLDAAGNYGGAYQPYQGLTANGYQLLLRPEGGAPANLDAYKGYFATHIKRAPSRRQRTAASKFLWSQNLGNLSYYCGYEYIGSRFVANFYSIDNILVRPFQGPPYDYQTTIMNPVVGTPFNAVGGPPGAPPIGTIPMGNGFTNVGGGWPLSPTAPNWTLGGSGNLVSWRNYGHIYSNSDHFAIYASI
jgi:hypothetical protein